MNVAASFNTIVVRQQINRCVYAKMHGIVVLALNLVRRLYIKIQREKIKQNTKYNRNFPIQYKWIFLFLTNKYFVGVSCYLVICAMHTSH